MLIGKGNIVAFEEGKIHWVFSETAFMLDNIMPNLIISHSGAHNSQICMYVHQMEASFSLKRPLGCVKVSITLYAAT